MSGIKYKENKITYQIVTDTGESLGLPLETEELVKEVLLEIIENELHLKELCLDTDIEKIKYLTIVPVLNDATVFEEDEIQLLAFENKNMATFLASKDYSPDQISELCLTGFLSNDFNLGYTHDVFTCEKDDMFSELFLNLFGIGFVEEHMVGLEEAVDKVAKLSSIYPKQVALFNDWISTRNIQRILFLKGW